MAEIKHLVNRIYCSRSAYYNPKFRENIRFCAPKIDVAVSHLTSILSLKELPLINMAPISGNGRKRTDVASFYTYGFMSFTGSIIIDPRFQLKKLLNVISHEIWHVRQFERKELSFKRDSFGRLEYIIWKDKPYNKANLTSKTAEKNFKEYISQPWEAEAFANEGWLIDEALRVVNPLI